MLGFVLLTAAMSSIVGVSSASASGRADAMLTALSEQIQICRRSDGSVRSAKTVDVLVLLDNSQSLSWPSKDPDGKRFEATDLFLDGYIQTESDVTRNFGLVSFGTSATEVVAMQEVTSENVASIKKEIRREVPNEDSAQEPHTNYLAALDAALRVFNSFDPTNSHCRVVIWFTDGEFDTTNTKNPNDQLRDAARLRREVCEANGFADRFNQGDINTFVVFLSKNDSGSPDANPRVQASKDAMVRISGDPSPTFGSEMTPGSYVFGDEQCGLSAGDRHLGEVISVEKVDEVIGHLTDLGPLIDGGERVFEGECPTDGVPASLPLIDGYLIDWVAITAWDSSGSSPAGVLRVRNAAGDEVRQLTDLFSSSTGGSSGRFDRLVPKDDEARRFLESGWRLEVGNAGRVCVRIRPRDLSFTVKGDGSVVSGEQIPSSLYSEDRLRFIKDGRSISVREALTTPVLDGELRVDNGGFLPKPGVLAVNVAVDGLFRVEPDDCRLTASYSGTEVPRGSIRTSECTLVPAAFEPTNVDASTLLAELKERCLDATWVVTVNGEPKPQNFSLDSVDQPVRLGIATDSDLPNEEVSCSGVSSTVTVSSAGSMAEIRSAISLDLIRRGNPALALGLSLLIALLVSLLSLVLLRLINHFMGRTIDSSRFYYYEVRARLKAETGAKATYEILADQAQRSKMDRLKSLQSDASRRSLVAGPLSFSRRLPGVLSPFGDARLVLTSNQVAKFWQVNARGDGLRLSFPRALIFSTEMRRAVGDSSSVDILITAIVPRSGQRSGFEGAEALIAERGQPLCEALHAAVKSQNAVERKGLPTESVGGWSRLRQWFPVRRESGGDVPSEAPSPGDKPPPNPRQNASRGGAKPPQPPSSGRHGPPGPPKKRDEV